MRRTSARPRGTSERSMYVQLPFAAWLAISARSAALQPTWSSAIACFRVRGAPGDQESSRLSVPEGVGSEATLEVFPVARRCLRRIPWRSGVGNFGVEGRRRHGFRSRDVLC
eukprot:4715802-Pleurochrysis_carterae.AAC.1